MAPFKQKRPLAHEQPGYRTGRPSEYRPEYCQQVLDYMGQGYSLTAFAGSIKVNKTSIYEWMGQHPDFSNAVTRGKAARVTALEIKLLKSRYGAQASSSIFALRNADPSEWRDIRQVQHDHSVTVQSMSDEQLIAIASGRDDGMIDVTPAPAPAKIRSSRK